MENLNFPPFKVNYFLSQIKPEGKIVYEYNPLRNYRISKKDTSENKKEGENEEDEIEEGTIVDLDTEKLNFSLNNPVTIDTQQSYDGSVNLILNDNRNIPRLINSRFSVLQNNTYEIVDRIGNNDTNLYDENQFDNDTSLYKRVNTIPTIEFKGVNNSGRLKVGNYVIYIKYADADDNETDFVGETGIISCFIGNDSDPLSIQGGSRNQISYKAINILVDNIDQGYDYIKVYYTRTTSDLDENRVVNAYRIEKKYPVKDNFTYITITGEENTTEISVDEINTKFFIADLSKCQAQCQNMLFLGNTGQADIMYKDLTDISLRMLPYLHKDSVDELIGNLDENYIDNSTAKNTGMYYNTNNIYYNLGYWDEEIYRLGVVYIFNNGSVSPVYNIRGRDKIPLKNKVLTSYDLTNYKIINEETNERQYISVQEGTYLIGSSQENENSKGVIRIQDSDDSIYGIGIYIPKEVVTYLKDKVQGLFFVRQKRIPTILCQAYTMPMDRESELPMINSMDSGFAYVESFLTKDRILDDNYKNRLYKREISTFFQAKAGICPEYELRMPYFNSLFTGTQFTVKESKIQNKANTLTSSFNERHYYSLDREGVGDSNLTKVHIIGVEDNVKAVSCQDQIFRARAGEAEQANKYSYIGSKNKSTDAHNLVRGSFGPYLGIVGSIDYGKLINIYIPGYDIENIKALFEVRYIDDSPYYPIGDRYSINNIPNQFDTEQEGYTKVFHRGDCYICNFTHRLNRNFQDPTAPTNDEIVDPKCWVDNYSVSDGVVDQSKFEKINLGDLNAVPLGSWITIRVRSSINLSIRSLDDTIPDEEALTGLKRGFFPLQDISVKGNTKIPESRLYNKGFETTTSEKVFFTLPDVPYIKNRYDTRISYSDIAISDAYKNGYRVFQFTHYRDYPKTYGGLMKLVEWKGDLIAVFEHGVALIPVNERAVAGEGSGGNVYINTSNVLPENPKIISDTFGTQWSESVIKTDKFVYGVDTVGKKIWRTDGERFEKISDFNVQEFLNLNISLTERELTPIIGIRNVKTHFNKFKNDIMFTFYDNLHGFNEKVWNLCYNEDLSKFITFYSWVPSYSENIDNVFFSFDRNTSKWISKLATTSIKSNDKNGIVLHNVLLDQWDTEHIEKIKIHKYNENDKPTVECYVKLDTYNIPLPNDDKTGVNYTINYILNRDNKNYYKYFRIGEINEDIIDEYQEEENGKLITKTKTILKKGQYLCYVKYKECERKDFFTTNKVPVALLNISCEIAIEEKPDQQKDIQEYVTGWKDFTERNEGMYQSVIAITNSTILQNGPYQDNSEKTPQLNLTTDFWKHGQAGIIDIKDEIKPTKWYGKQHPFEFEFIVADNPDKHKIFDALQIISNKAEPESFHYEIVGECYDFSKDKKNMYIRQEATKELYQYNGSDILFNSDYVNLDSEHRKNYRIEEGQRIELKGYDRSTLFPLYYQRRDSINEIEDYYAGATAPSKDYSALAGGEIIRYDTLNEYHIWNHAKAVDVSDPTKGRMRGNMQYKEDKWHVQINPLNIVQKNEPQWTNLEGNPTNCVPVELKQNPLPSDVLNPETMQVPSSFEKGQGRGYVVWNWQESQISEAKIKDKWLKVRIRYKGNKLAIITAIRTLYSISYS